MALNFNDASNARIKKLLSRYPNKMAATLPVLWIAQEQFGYVSEEAMDLVAETLDLPKSHVYGVATFYTMYYKDPVGKHHVQVCTNVSCMLRGAYQVLERFEKELGVKAGETSADGNWTLSEVECLAACGTAPCVQVNKNYYEPVLPDDVPALIAKLRSGAGSTTESRSTEPKSHV